MPQLQTAYLVIRADRIMRIAKRPRLSWDETAIKLNVVFPDGWGKVSGELNLTLPEFTPTIEAESGETTIEDRDA